MSATSAPTLRKLPERMTLRIISPKKRSTKLARKRRFVYGANESGDDA